MAKRITFIIALAAMISSFCLAGEYVPRIPRVSYVDGDVSMQESGSTGWTSVDVNLPLQEGDRLVLDRNGLVELEVDDGSFLRLNQFSELLVNRLEEQQVQLQFLQGQLIIRVNSDVNYIINTPLGDVNLLSGGVYRINIDQDHSVEVLVRNGQARFVNQYIDRDIRDGSRLFVTPDGRKYVRGSADQFDSFDNWSDRRDARYASIESKRYLPRDVNYGLYDLDSYGRWVNVGSYGYCWAPSVYVSGWAPYRYGYWRYTHRWGWTWISYDPWGWLPYHYGRWFCDATFGWVWYPGSSWGISYWSPGLVRFSIYNGYIGWLPLGPGDYYYGYHNGRHGNRITNNFVTINNNYYNLTNRRQINAVSYMRIDDFQHGRAIGTGVYSRNALNRGAASRQTSRGFQSNNQLARQLFQRDRIIRDTPKVDPLRGSSVAYSRTRAGSPTDRYSAERTNTRATNANTRQRSLNSSLVGSGGRYSGSMTNFDRSRNTSNQSINRGRPGVSTTPVQDRSRSRRQSEVTNSRSSGSTTRGSSSLNNRSRTGSSSSSRSLNRSTTRGSSSTGSRSVGPTRSNTSRSNTSRSNNSRSRQQSNSRERKVPSPGDISSNSSFNRSSTSNRTYAPASRSYPSTASNRSGVVTISSSRPTNANRSFQSSDRSLSANTRSSYNRSIGQRTNRNYSSPTRGYSFGTVNRNRSTPVRSTNNSINRTSRASTFNRSSRSSSVNRSYSNSRSTYSRSQSVNRGSSGARSTRSSSSRSGSTSRSGHRR